MSEQETNYEEQFEEMYYQKAIDLSSRLLHRSAMNVLLEGKRFAKTNRLLIPYIYSCFLLTNNAQSMYEPELGIDNAMEMIAYLESPEKCRKFQHDYNEDQYQYFVSKLSACAYDNLAVHTALRLGYNSPTVFGAVDDGIMVCRRTGKLECVQCFREYATRISLASGDYEMGEHHARLCATSTEREDADDRRYVGHMDLVRLFLQQGKFQAALDVLDVILPFAENYHSPNDSLLTCHIYAEKVFWLTGKENELPAFLTNHGYPKKPQPPRDEAAEYYVDTSLGEAIKLARYDRWLDAVDCLEKCEQFLNSQDVLNPWFPIRIAKIANLLLAKEHGLAIHVDLDRSIAELKTRANKAHHWSAIQAVQAMEEKRVRLNPLGIPFPIDLGPYATPGTPISAARLGMTLPMITPTPCCSEHEKMSPQTPEENTESNTTDHVTQTPLQEKVKDLCDRINALSSEQREYYSQWNDCEEEKDDDDDDEVKQATIPFPKLQELLDLEQEYLSLALSYHANATTPITLDEFLTLARDLSQMTLLSEKPELIQSIWKWNISFQPIYPQNAKLVAHYAIDAYFLREKAENKQIDPKSLGLPEPEVYLKWIEQAFALDPNNVKIVTAAGMLFLNNDNEREARRYFSRACQLDRLNEFATHSLSNLYEKANRLDDALAVIDLYTRAGGRHPGLLWMATSLAFQNQNPNQFFLYYDAFTQITQPDFQLKAEYFWALMESGRYDDALTLLDHFDEEFESTSRDRLYLRAYCLAQTGKKWTTPVEAALKLIPQDGAVEGLLGQYWEPCEKLWDTIARWSENDPRRLEYEKFIMVRGLVPTSYFHPEVLEGSCQNHFTDHSENTDEDQMLEDLDSMMNTEHHKCDESCDCCDECDENDEYDGPTKTLYRCSVQQPLNPEVPAFAGWIAIPTEVPYYIADWFVLADSPEEAIQLALESQKQCYVLPPVPTDDCEEIDLYPATESGILIQGKREFNQPEDD